MCSLKLSGTYRNRKNCIYSSIVFFLFYFFEVLLTILKNGFRNRAAFVSLQFVGFQPSFQVLGAALPKYGESSVIQQSKSFLLSSNLSKMRKLLLSSELYNEHHKRILDKAISCRSILIFYILTSDQIGLNLY